MEIGIHNWMRAEPLEVTLRRISNLGYDKLEIQGTPEAYNNKKVLKLLQDYGISCWGSVTLMLDERNLLAKDKKQRAESIKYVMQVAKMVKELNGKVISLVPSTVGKVIPEGRPEEDWELAVEGIKEVYHYTENEGLLIGIEPINRFETYFINRGDQALELAKAVGPNCGVALDTFHMNIEENNMIEAIKRVGSRLVNFHVSDNNRMAPGMGTLDWKKILKTLDEINYDQVLSVEFCPPLDRTPANPFPNSIDHNPEGLDPQAKKFLEDHGSAAMTDEFYTMLTRKTIETLRPLIK